MKDTEILDREYPEMNDPKAQEMNDPQIQTAAPQENLQNKILIVRFSQLL